MQSDKNVLEKWLLLAEDDFDSAKIMLKNKKILITAFFLHQTVEKLLKALYYFKFKKEPPYTHNLNLLENETALNKKLDNTFYDFFHTLNPFYIKARYPTYKDEVKSTLNTKKLADLIKQTGVLFKCVKAEMKQKK